MKSVAMRTKRVRVSVLSDFSAKEVADYIFNPDVVETWLGSHSRIRKRLYSNAILMQVSHNLDRILEEGTIVSLLWPASTGNPIPVGIYQITASMPKTYGSSLVHIRISPQSGGGCRIRIQQDNIPLTGVQSYVDLWQKALNKVQHLLLQAHNMYCRDRQAVVLVHGIGEQRPGQMLREFMENIFDRNAGEYYYIKPDHVSSLFEMRKATVPKGNSLRPATDVYELYWAHNIQDTTLPQVYSWLVRLIFSRWAKIPKTLRDLVTITRALLLVVAIITLFCIVYPIPAGLKGITGSVLLALWLVFPFILKTFGNYYLINFAGDAARYLEPRACNISRRQEIRQAGVEFIDALHSRGRYSRIIVYGHSLGSVIAYDILSLAWVHHRSRIHKPPPNVRSHRIMALESMFNRILTNRAELDLKHIQRMQYKAWLEYRQNGFSWLVSDFITAGSPLAHAQWLLNLDSRTSFNDLRSERSFPTCPPQTESPTIFSTKNNIRQKFTFTHSFKDPNEDNSNRQLSVQVPHHGGLFAIIRWTNLFFPCSGLSLRGDPIGGPLSQNFGQWVNDISLMQTKRTFAHCLYTKRSVDTNAVEALRKALRLEQSIYYYASALKQDD
jgi:hypothetical protein